MTLVDCPECLGPLVVVFARSGIDDEGEVTDVYCPICKWEGVDPELGEAVVEP